MNLIADNLFALLLGWTRSLFNSLWNLVTNNGGGLVGFLQRFWLPILIILLLAGTFFDLVIWLIRWRPHYVWSTNLRMRANKRHLNRTKSFMEDLDHSPLDLPEYQQAGQEQLDEPVYFGFEPHDATETPYYSEPMDLEQLPYEEQVIEEPMFVPNLPWQPIFPENMLQNDSSTQQPEYLMEEPLYDVAPEIPYQDLDYMQEPLEETQPGSLRRRRADIRRQRGKMLKNLKDTFFASEDDLSPIDSLQSPVNPQDAFHKPYYPQGYAYKEQSNHFPQDEQNH